MKTVAFPPPGAAAAQPELTPPPVGPAGLAGETDTVWTPRSSFSFRVTCGPPEPFVIRGRGWSHYRTGRDRHPYGASRPLLAHYRHIGARFMNWFRALPGWFGIARDIRQDFPRDFADLLHFNLSAGSTGLVAAPDGHRDSKGKIGNVRKAFGEVRNA